MPTFAQFSRAILQADDTTVLFKTGSATKVAIGLAYFNAGSQVGGLLGTRTLEYTCSQVDGYDPDEAAVSVTLEWFALTNLDTSKKPVEVNVPEGMETLAVRSTQIVPAVGATHYRLFMIRCA